MARHLGFSVIAATFAAVLPAFPLAPGTTPAEQARVRQVLERGNLIYAYDQVAWHGTDDMRAKLKDAEAKVGGWIADGPASGPELVFFDKDPSDPKALYVARFKSDGSISGKVLGDGDDRSLSAERKRLIAAQRTARESLDPKRAQPCSSRPFNTIVLPPETPGGPVLVYFLTPQTDSDAIPFGGHYLVEVSPEGKAGPTRRFTKSCLDMPFRKAGVPAPAAIGVSHLLDPVPTEIHVFSSLAARLPVMVMATKKKVWMVAGDRIRPIDPDAVR
jgi:hypothetical protein